MYLSMLKSKIHRATVTQAELNYVGSITIDEELMEAAGILEYERVHIANVNNGSGCTFRSERRYNNNNGICGYDSGGSERKFA